MTRQIDTSQHGRARGRFLALLLALLLAMTSLSSHGARQAEQADCLLTPQAAMQLDAADTDDHRCSACSALMPSFSLSTVEPAVSATAPAVAYVKRTFLPPLRPPRA
ncbi:hypothetical protein [Halomonas sp. DQ26W]|uniref:hypothetical protein n=1 Tax=Halomonas sp. DQ26W TaxID=2282311 RepID=UPI000DF8041C|nr:hypothetical protein [Halomonas sp. DQ26W]